MINRDELNKAIRTVLTTQYKKQAKEAFQMVENAGYEIYKMGGDWRVKNNKTGRIVYLEDGWRSTFIWHGNRWENRTQCKGSEDTATMRLFDFVGALEKPLNKDYYTSIAFTYENESKARQRYDELKSARRSVKWYDEDINNIKKQMQKLQDELVRKAQYKLEAEQTLKKVRKELGLAK